MSWYALLIAAAAGAALLLLVAKLRGGGRGDLLGPPRARPRRLSREELDRMTELIGRGEQAEVERQLKSAGYDEAQTRRLVWLMTKLAED
jgi:hypothetical protein